MFSIFASARRIFAFAVSLAAIALIMVLATTHPEYITNTAHFFRRMWDNGFQFFHDLGQSSRAPVRQ